MTLVAHGSAGGHVAREPDVVASPHQHCRSREAAPPRSPLRNRNSGTHGCISYYWRRPASSQTSGARSGFRRAHRPIRPSPRRGNTRSRTDEAPSPSAGLHSHQLTSSLGRFVRRKCRASPAIRSESLSESRAESTISAAESADDAVERSSTREASSTIKCALLPPAPKAFIPARRGC